MNPFTGVWRLDPERSRFASTVPREWLQAIRQDGEGISVRERMVRSDGVVIAVAMDARMDGAEYPVEGSPVADTIAYERLDAYTLRGVGRKDGAVSLRELVTVDAAAGTLTLEYAVCFNGRVTASGVAVFVRD